jgi:hypothetical protein
MISGAPIPRIESTKGRRLPARHARKRTCPERCNLGRGAPFASKKEASDKFFVSMQARFNKQLTITDYERNRSFYLDSEWLLSFCSTPPVFQLKSRRKAAFFIAFAFFLTFH